MGVVVFDTVEVVLGKVKSTAPLLDDMNNNDLDARSKLKVSSFKRSEFSNSFIPNSSDASIPLLTLVVLVGVVVLSLSL